MEVLLWLCLLLPGILYSLWRITSRYKGCPVCGARNPIPLETPAGKALAAM
jgi:hypothetical protein